MDFNVKSWVGDIYHKVESMIQEVDDIMKEKADPVGQNVQDSRENKKKFSLVEVHATLKRVKESYSPLTNGKKPEEGQKACGPPVNGITVESDESEEGHTEATSNCKSTLMKVDEVSQVITGHSEITQPLTDYLDPKTSESKPATQVACSVSRHSSMSLEFPSEIGEDEKPTTSSMGRSLQDVTAACGIDEAVPLAYLLEEDGRQFQDSGKCGAYLIDPNMETIDLEDKEELQESCATVDVRDLLAVSERVKRFRSIKRKILDAFTSRQRTSKEYEQLGILHGDLNFEHGGHLMLNTVPFLDNRSSVEHADDSDWELL